tara:strand:- start:63 stop:239 length:177 start_codon:yes stop_codon:yes gene_type:complete
MSEEQQGQQEQVEISLEDVLNQLSLRGQQEWDLAMKKAEIHALETSLNSVETPENRDS